MLCDIRYLLSHLQADRTSSVSSGLDNACWEVRNDRYFYQMVITFTAGGVCQRVLQKQHQELTVCCQERPTDSQVQTQEKRVSNDLCKSLAFKYALCVRVDNSIINQYIYFLDNQEMIIELFYLSDKWRT